MKPEEAVGLLLIAVVVVLAVVFLRPKGLDAALGDGFSPEEVTAVSATLSPAAGGEEITLDIPAGGGGLRPATGPSPGAQLLPHLHQGRPDRLGLRGVSPFCQRGNVGLDLSVPGGASWSRPAPTGETKTYQISGGQTTQERILDFLLAQ